MPNLKKIHERKSKYDCRTAFHLYCYKRLQACENATEF